ncbi:MAG: outer membrane protein transport protein, partial [Cohaesibacter sp.]|nr:outer membrane protein transport protein [Cohaesibacter sp.]
IAYRVNDMISVGAAVGAQYFDVRLTSYPTVSLARQQELTGDDIAPSYSLGMTLSPRDGTEFGIGFRGAVFHELEGKESFNGATWNGVIPGLAGSHSIKADLVTPEKITVGLRQRVNDAFTVMAGLEWTNWSRIGAPPVKGSPTNTTLSLNYEDGWYASLGAEYAYNDNLTLRAGLGYETSPIPEEHRNMRLADADRLWVSAGLSYQVSDKIGLDVGYSHIFVEKTSVNGKIGAISYTGHSEGAADILSASLRYQWKPEPMFAGDEPFVRKY